MKMGGEFPGRFVPEARGRDRRDLAGPTIAALGLHAVLVAGIALGAADNTASRLRVVPAEVVTAGPARLGAMSEPVPVEAANIPAAKETIGAQEARPASMEGRSGMTGDRNSGIEAGKAATVQTIEEPAVLLDDAVTVRRPPVEKSPSYTDTVITVAPEYALARPRPRPTVPETNRNAAPAEIPSRLPQGVPPESGGAGDEMSPDGELDAPPDGNTGEPLAFKLLASPMPEYPYRARRDEVEGIVLLRLTVDPTGLIVSVAVQESSGDVRLDSAARQGVSRWRFAPTGRVGEVSVPIEFRLDE